MPIHKTKSGGYKWGKSGKVYKTRAGRFVCCSNVCWCGYA